MSLPFDESGAQSSATFGRGVEVAFVVYGQPMTKGNIKSFAFIDKKTGKARSVMTHREGRSLRDWENNIRQAAQKYAAQGFFLRRGEPVEIQFWFYFTRPQSKKAGTPMTVKPDYDKVARAVSDALTSVLFGDDAQITDAHIHKRYIDGPSHVKVVIRRADAA